MVKIPEEAIPGTYRQFMEEVKVRLAASRTALKAAYRRLERPDTYLLAEFAVMQVRRITELVALGVVVAHNEIDDFRTNKLVDQWNADALFGQLAKLSDTAFPEPFTVTATDKDGNASIFINPENHMTKAELTSIYNKCGSLLHSGKLKSLGKPKRYDLGEIQQWCIRLIRLLDHHVILLPGMQRSMIVFMAHEPDGHVHCQLSPLVKESGPPPYVKR
jgi:hypothetical protein